MKVVAWSSGFAIFNKAKQTLYITMKKTVLTGHWLRSL